VHTIPYGSNLSLLDYPPNPSRIGYTFTGWTPYEDKTALIAAHPTMPAYDITITANYTQNDYYIYFKEEAEQGGATLATVTKHYGDSLSAADYPSDPVESGFEFVGWNPASLPSTMPNNNITVYALQAKIPSAPRIVENHGTSYVYFDVYNDNNDYTPD
jgi:uncharacterized repeat protein (TIGR02543 family)